MAKLAAPARKADQGVKVPLPDDNSRGISRTREDDSENVDKWKSRSLASPLKAVPN